MLSPFRSRVAAVLILIGVVVSVVFVVVAAQDDEDTTPVDPQLPGAVVATVDVVSTSDFRLDVSRSSVPPGVVEFRYRSEEGSHRLSIVGVPGFQLTSAGEEASGSVRLAAGTYLLHCEISGHEDAGERATLEVG